jgi:hypothetical protein
VEGQDPITVGVNLVEPLPGHLKVAHCLRASMRWPVWELKLLTLGPDELRASSKGNHTWACKCVLAERFVVFAVAAEYVAGPPAAAVVRAVPTAKSFHLKDVGRRDERDHHRRDS